jgi:hypothetical protein
LTCSFHRSLICVMVSVYRQQDNGRVGWRVLGVFDLGISGAFWHNCIPIGVATKTLAFGLF